MVHRSGRGNWVYKKTCPRCGELKNVGSKHGKICVDCLLPHYRSPGYLKAKRELHKRLEFRGVKQ